jgi:oligosaccharyltransferase complex subunit alpha (ribophorin I)
VQLDIRPRFPIMGGWKSNYNIGYNLPTKFQVKSEKNDLYVLNLTFGLPYEDLVARNYSMKIVLPEGAHSVKVFLY